MANKITNFEDYKKKDNVPGDTTDIDIQIEDPVNFFNAQEREEFFQERQKEQVQQAPVQDPYINQDQGYYQEHGQNDDPLHDEEYDEDYEDDYYGDEEEDEEDDDSSGFPIEIFIRISSIITGIIILAFLAIVAKVKIYDRYFAKDPDEEQVVVSELALPSGYTEKNDTVVVTAKQLNLRTVDNSQSDSTIVTAVPEGTELKRVGINADGTWALVEYNGTRVYASMKYLSEK